MHSDTLAESRNGPSLHRPVTGRTGPVAVLDVLVEARGWRLESRKSPARAGRWYRGAPELPP